MAKSLNELLFMLWMQDNHPYFFFIRGLIFLLLTLTILTSIILGFFNIEWWWKLGLLAAGLIFLTNMLGRAILSSYIDDYNARK